MTLRMDDDWIQRNPHMISEGSAKFLLDFHATGRMKFPLSEASLAILRRAAGILVAEPSGGTIVLNLPAAPPGIHPPPFIVDNQSKAAGEREEF